MENPKKLIVEIKGRFCVETEKENINGEFEKRYEDGYKYIGQIERGEPNGYGVLHMCNDRRYEGQWKDGKKDGYGICYFPSGARYEGQLKDGVQEGYGVLYSYDSQKVYAGDWRDNMRDGFGISYVGGVKCYEGTWSKDCMHGAGVLYEDNGRFECEWHEGCRVLDNCTGYFANGDVYKGAMTHSWKPNGRGTMTWTDGSKFMGIFKDGKPVIQ